MVGGIGASPSRCAADGGDAIREKLRERTGQRNVPFVFVGGRFIAAQEVMDGMRGPGAALRPALEVRSAPLQKYASRESLITSAGRGRAAHGLL